MAIFSQVVIQNQSTVIVNLQHNGFFRNDVIFSPWDHDAIA